MPCSEFTVCGSGSFAGAENRKRIIEAGGVLWTLPLEILLQGKPHIVFRVVVRVGAISAIRCPPKLCVELLDTHAVVRPVPTGWIGLSTGRSFQSCINGGPPMLAIPPVVRRSQCRYSCSAVAARVIHCIRRRTV